MNHQKITEFFQQQKKTNSNVIRPESINRITDAEEFFQSCLNQTECKKNTCVNLKAALNAQLREIQEKSKHHEEAVKLCSTIIEEKDNEIEKLEEILANRKLFLCQTKAYQHRKMR